MTEYLKPEALKISLSKTNDTIIKVAAIVGAVTIIAGGYTWYLNNIWKPHIELISVDFDNGKAQLKHRSKIIELDGDAIYWINADWGLRLGVLLNDGKPVYDRVELLKKGMVVEYIKNNEI
jgi:hypothetical protein